MTAYVEVTLLFKKEVWMKVGGASGGNRSMLARERGLSFLKQKLKHKLPSQRPLTQGHLAVLIAALECRQT